MIGVRNKVTTRHSFAYLRFYARYNEGKRSCSENTRSYNVLER